MELNRKDKWKSHVVAEAIMPVPKMCWWNSQRALLGHEEADGLYYVEGFLVQVDLPLPMEHGWLEEADGTVVDPTLPECDGSYFVAFRYSKNELIDLMKRYPSLEDVCNPACFAVHGHGQWRTAAYWSAYVRANVACYGKQILEVMQLGDSDYVERVLQGENLAPQSRKAV